MMMIPVTVPVNTCGHPGSTFQMLNRACMAMLFVQGTQALFDSSESTVRLVGDVEASDQEVSLRFNEELAFKVPFKPKTTLSGKLTLTRGDSAISTLNMRCATPDTTSSIRADEMIFSFTVLLQMPFSWSSIPPLHSAQSPSIPLIIIIIVVVVVIIIIIIISSSYHHRRRRRYHHHHQQ